MRQVKLIAISDTDSRKEETIHRAGFRYYSDFRRMLQEENLDAVVIATPNYLHKEQAKASLLSGKHVLCEKPMATSLDDARSMTATARKAGKILFVPFH